MVVSFFDDFSSPFFTHSVTFCHDSVTFSVRSGMSSSRSVFWNSALARVVHLLTVVDFLVVCCFRAKSIFINLCSDSHIEPDFALVLWSMCAVYTWLIHNLSNFYVLRKVCQRYNSVVFLQILKQLNAESGFTLLFTNCSSFIGSFKPRI